MSNYLQSEFNKFHDNIKLNDLDDNKELREKRDMLTGELRTYFKKKAEDEGTTRITFSVENQGSYSMGTGVKPLEGDDYDIDVMILFNISKEDYTPVQVKRWVYEALDISQRDVKYKKPCVQVQYHKAGELRYHVDFALYANENDNGEIYLSKGKPTSATADKKWEVSEPKELKEKINNHFSDSDDRQQMKRIIRYLKRWKDLKFKNTGNGRPTGIALTALTYNLFNPQIDRNSFSSTITPKDIVALKELVRNILRKFNWSNEISVSLPVAPYNDLFEKMRDGHYKTFKEKLEKLKTALEDAIDEPDPHEASKILIKQFGEDFPEVGKDKSGQRRSQAFPGKSESA